MKKIKIIQILPYTNKPTKVFKNCFDFLNKLYQMIKNQINFISCQKHIYFKVIIFTDKKNLQETF